MSSLYICIYSFCFFFLYYRYIIDIKRHMLLPRLSVKSENSKKNSINEDLFSKNPPMLRHVSLYFFTYDCLATLTSWSYMPGPVSLTNEVNWLYLFCSNIWGWSYSCKKNRHQIIILRLYPSFIPIIRDINKSHCHCVINILK